MLETWAVWESVSDHIAHAVDAMQRVTHIVYHFVGVGEIIVGVQVTLLHGHVVDVARYLPDDQLAETALADFEDVAV
jgi:hypothetical protein